MTITIATPKLIGLLNAALHTSDKTGKSGVGIHMSTHRGEYGSEPGQTDLLAALSCGVRVVGEGRITCDGQFLAHVWPLDSTKTVIHVCQALVQAYGKEHTVDIDVARIPTREGVGKDGQDTDPGFMVTLRETPMLFDSETEFQFQAKSEKSFPMRTASRWLNGQATDPKFIESSEINWIASTLTSIAAVAKQIGAAPAFYPTPGGYVQRIQIGEYWIGAAMPLKPAPGEKPRLEPSVEPLLAVEPDEADGDEAEVFDGWFVDEPLPGIGGGTMAALPAGDSTPALEAGDDNVIDAEVVDEEDPADPNYDHEYGPGEHPDEIETASEDSADSDTDGCGE